MNNIVVVVGFELRNNPLDDYGIECVCMDEIVAKNHIIEMNKKHPEYKFEILGDYVLLEGKDGD
jgi:hypothetical protein